MSQDHAKLWKYWLEQVRTGRGAGMVFYRGSRMQKGHGLASILGGIVKSPMVRKGLAYAAKTALNTGGDLISNLASGQDFKTAASSSFARQKNIQKRKAVNAIKNMVRPRAPPRRRRPQIKKMKKRGRRYRATDNFGSVRR